MLKNFPEGRRAVSRTMELGLVNIIASPLLSATLVVEQRVCNRLGLQ